MRDKRKRSLKGKHLNVQLEPIRSSRSVYLNSHRYRTVTEFCYLNTYNPFFENFNNITMWLNLTCVNLQNNSLTVLPREFGKLLLRELNLSQNYFGTSNSTKWPWIEQNDIKNTLLSLNMSYNSLTELPSNIKKLKALVRLDVQHNLLKRLPQSIGNMQKLAFLNVARNKLQYLPATIIFANLRNFNIEMNPFQTQKQNKYNVPSLIKLTANIVLQHRIPYATRLPRICAKYFEEVECCFLCRRFGIGLLPLYVSLPYNFPICYAKCHVYCSANDTIQFEIYCCPSSCKNNIRYANYNCNINTLIDYIRRRILLRRRNCLENKLDNYSIT